MTLLTDWADFGIKTVIGAVITYVTTKYAITHTEKIGKKTMRRIRGKA